MKKEYKDDLISHSIVQILRLTMNSSWKQLLIVCVLICAKKKKKKENKEMEAQGNV